MKASRFGILAATIVTCTLAGCAHNRRTVVGRPAVVGYAEPCPCDTLPRGRLTPSPLGPAPLAPAPLTPGPPAGNPPQGFVPAAPPDNARSEFRAYPPTDPTWTAPADPVPQDPLSPGVRLHPPEVGENQQPIPRRDDPSVLPVDIPQFAIARKQVASGQKPFTEGLDWLLDRGYRNVLHVRAPGEDDSAARRQFTAKGFRYESIELSPETLNRDAVDQFNRAVTDPANLPLFVYDRDSALVGGLWYLHFRVHEGYSDDRAAIEAGRLGLNIDADGGPHREMWLAIQRYLQMSKPAARPSKIRTAVWSRPAR